MKVVFMGTPEFAVPSLRELHAKHEVVAVVTQPDRRRGRGQLYSFSPVKQFAVERNLKVLQPEKVNDSEFIDELSGYEADIFVIVAFGQKIPESLLNMPIHGCINVHSSLLPKFRGAAPINAAIAAGHGQTGVTTMYLASGWDTGDIILQREVPILQRDTAGSLHDRLMEIGAELLIETLEQIEMGKAPRIVQNHDEATYAFKLKKGDGRVDLSLPARELDYLIRGMNPWPGAFITIEKEDVKIWEALPCDEGGKVGEILDISTRGLLVGCGKGSLLLQRLQRPNSKATSGQDFANGLRLVVGDSLKSPNRA